MGRLKTKSLEQIEERMGDLNGDSIRYKVLESAKNFKSSWINLGQALYSVWKDRLYKDWGYMTFDAYTSKEIGIKKPTAMKLLKSYYFLEKEEPAYLETDNGDKDNPAIVPTYEAVNILRLAKSKNMLDKEDYARFKKDVFEMGRDATAVKRDLTTLMRQKEELGPEEARNKKKVAMIKRLLTVLKTLKTDIEASKMLPANILKETVNLIHKIEAEIS